MNHLLSKRRVRHFSLARLAFFSALAVGTVSLSPQQAQARVFVSINLAPPALPIYEQPAIPGPGYIWTPGYWAYDDVDGYYWVPGTWILPPYIGALWTPGYWGWSNGAYAFNQGYWGLHVGFYGGINYGFGYGGIGYVGGYWGPHGFYYNRAVNHITNVHITNVYSKTVVNHTVNRASFNGPGGIAAHPTAQQLAYRHEAHTPPIAAQVQHQNLASHTQALRASVNHGTPSIAATPRPNAFTTRTVSAARSDNVRATTRSTISSPAAVSRTSTATRASSTASLPSANYAHRSAVATPATHAQVSHAIANQSNRTASTTYSRSSSNVTARTTTTHSNVPPHVNVSRTNTTGTGTPAHRTVNPTRTYATSHASSSPAGHPTGASTPHPSSTSHPVTSSDGRESKPERH